RLRLEVQVGQRRRDVGHATSWIVVCCRMLRAAAELCAMLIRIAAPALSERVSLTDTVGSPSAAGKSSGSCAVVVVSSPSVSIRKVANIHLPACAPEYRKMSDVTAYTPAAVTFGNVALVRFSSAVSDTYTHFRFVTVF